jgi:uncharacterized membrane protein
MAEQAKPNEESGDPKLPILLQEELAKIVPEKDKREEILRAIGAIAVKSSSSYSGPLPPPEMLKQFDEVLPGLAKIIVDRVEKQSDHRMRLEERTIFEQLSESRRGQHYGLVIGLSGLLTCAVLALMGHDTVAAVIGAMDLAGLVAIFVIGKREQRKSLEGKRP